MTPEEVFEMWREYFRYYGSFPKYVECCIQWHDDVGCANVTIALFPYDEKTVSDEDDDQIFFYCEGIRDFLHLFDEGKEDFSVRNVYRFSVTL